MLSKITFGYAYKKEAKRFNDYKKVLAVYKNIGSRDEARMKPSDSSKIAGKAKGASPGLSLALAEKAKRIFINREKAARARPPPVPDIAKKNSRSENSAGIAR